MIAAFTFHEVERLRRLWLRLRLWLTGGVRRDHRSRFLTFTPRRQPAMASELAAVIERLQWLAAHDHALYRMTLGIFNRLLKHYRVPSAHRKD